jgi:hypothetical protein
VRRPRRRHDDAQVRPLDESIVNPVGREQIHSEAWPQGALFEAMLLLLPLPLLFPLIVGALVCEMIRRLYALTRGAHGQRPE